MRKILKSRCHSSHVIEDAQKDTEEHLSNPQDDGHLHLVGVGEHQLVLCSLPDLGDQVRSGDPCAVK